VWYWEEGREKARENGKPGKSAATLALAANVNMPTAECHLRRGDGLGNKRK